MPITKSAAKRHKQSILQRSRSDRRRLAFRTFEKQIRALVAEKKAGEAAALLPKVSQAFDKAAQRNVIHKNTASRHKSRLMKLVAKASEKIKAPVAKPAAKKAAAKKKIPAAKAKKTKAA